jgi:hypothetical protein
VPASAASVTEAQAQNAKAVVTTESIFRRRMAPK